MHASFYKKVFLLLVLTGLPIVVSAQVVINEVQLLPTGDRFIELYNQGNDAVDLTDWFIQRKTATGSTFSSLVSKTYFAGKSIAGNSYFLISRSGFSGSDIVVDNLTLTESNTLLLKNSEGEVDKFGWGSASDCQTTCPENPAEGMSLQHVSGTWIASSPTPRAANSDTSSATSESVETSTTTSSSTNTSSNSGSSSGSLSSHYSSSLLSKKTQAAISLSGGRDRLGSVGSPLEFKVDTNLTYTKNAQFRWTLGDGGEEYGETIVHTYEFPGEYVVVLNADLPEGKGVTRLNVKIVEAELEITAADASKVTIKNNSKSEVSLYGRALWSGGNAFVFSQDTIIKAGQSVSFSSSVTGLIPATNFDAQLLVVGDTERSKITAKIEEERQEKITMIENQIAALKTQMVSLSNTVPSASLSTISPVAPIIPVESTIPVEIENVQELEKIQTASALNSVEALESNGEKGFKGWLGVIKRFFLRTK